MDYAEIRKIAQDVVSDVLEIGTDEFSDDTDFGELSADSIQRLEIVAILRNRLGIRYGLEDESRMNSIDDIISITRAQVSG